METGLFRISAWLLHSFSWPQRRLVCTTYVQQVPAEEQYTDALVPDWHHNKTWLQLVQAVWGKSDKYTSTSDLVATSPASSEIRANVERSAAERQLLVASRAQSGWMNGQILMIAWPCMLHSGFFRATAGRSCDRKSWGFVSFHTDRSMWFCWLIAAFWLRLLISKISCLWLDWKPASTQLSMGDDGPPLPCCWPSDRRRSTTGFQMFLQEFSLFTNRISHSNTKGVD